MVTRLSIALPLVAVCGLMMGCQASHKGPKSCHSTAKADRGCHSPCHESSAKTAAVKTDSACPKAATADGKVCADKAADAKSCATCPAAEAKACTEKKSADAKTGGDCAQAAEAKSCAASPAVAESSSCAGAPVIDAKAQSCGSATVEPLPQEKDKPFAVVKRVKQAPRIDGVIDESWGNPTLTGFFSEDTRKPVKPAVQTQVWLCYDDQNLYVAARMLEPNMDELQANMTERDSSVWEEDDIEIFLDPNNKAGASDYVQLAANSIGTFADQRCSGDAGDDISWDCKGCQVKASKGEGFWVVEMAIPFESLAVAGRVAGQHWGANFARGRKCGTAENSTWSDLGTNWHQPGQFGHIAFQP